MTLKVLHPGVVESAWIDGDLIFGCIAMLGRVTGMGFVMPFDKDGFCRAMTRQVHIFNSLTERGREKEREMGDEYLSLSLVLFFSLVLSLQLILSLSFSLSRLFPVSLLLLVMPFDKDGFCRTMTRQVHIFNSKREIEKGREREKR